MNKRRLFIKNQEERMITQQLIYLIAAEGDTL